MTDQDVENEIKLIFARAKAAALQEVMAFLLKRAPGGHGGMAEICGNAIAKSFACLDGGDVKRDFKRSSSGIPAPDELLDLVSAAISESSLADDFIVTARFNERGYFEGIGFLSTGGKP